MQRCGIEGNFGSMNKCLDSVSPHRGYAVTTCSWRRHLRVCPSASTSLVTSYRLATRSNIAATAVGCLSKSALLTDSVSHQGIHRLAGERPGSAVAQADARL